MIIRIRTENKKGIEYQNPGIRVVQLREKGFLGHMYQPENQIYSVT